MPIDGVDAELSMLIAERPPFAGLDLKRPIVMGVVNVTPDSFSDGGGFFDTEDAIAYTEIIPNSTV